MKMPSADSPSADLSRADLAQVGFAAGALPAGEQTDEAPLSATRRRLRYLLISLLILVLDQATKWLVEASLTLHESKNIVPGLLNFVYVRNTGVAFGLFPAYGDLKGTLILAGAGLIALTFVVWYFWTTPLEDRALLWALSLIIGGAIGNLLDRLVQGGVTDFIDFNFQGYHWHTFNIADSAITIGISLMVIGTLRGHPKEANAGSQPAGDLAGEPFGVPHQPAEAPVAENTAPGPDASGR